MVLYVNVDERNRIVAIADEGFHLGSDECEAEFADELVQNGHVKIYDDRMIPMYKLIDGVAVTRTQEDIDADYVPPEPSTPNDLEARMLAMEQLLASYEAAYAQGVQDA